MFLEDNSENICLQIQQKRFHNDLLDRLVASKIDDEDDLGKEIQRYWNELIYQNECQRFSADQKLAFAFLKKIYKYNTFEKREERRSGS